MTNQDTVKRVRSPGVVLTLILFCAGLGGLAHAVYAARMWYDLLAGETSNLFMGVYPNWYIDALPTGILLLTCVGVVITAFQHRQFAILLLLWAVVAGAVFFLHDVTNQNWQGMTVVPVWGREFLYGNWPLYRRPPLDNEMCGFIDQNGYFVINPEFKMGRSFSEGLAPVYIDSKWGYIDRMGRIIISPQFDRAGRFCDGVAIVRREHKDGLIDKKGAFVLEPSYARIHPFSDGLAHVRARGKHGFIDMAGTFVIEPVFDMAGDFAEGLACFQERGKWGYVDQSGRIVIEPIYDAAGTFSGGLAVVNKGGKCGYIGRDGSFVIPPAFDSASQFSEGLAAVGMNGKYGFIEGSGQIVIEPKYDSVGYFSRGIAGVSANGKTLFMDKSGQVVNVAYARTGVFKEGLASVLIKRKYGFIDHDNRIVIKPRFYNATDFSEGLAAVSVLKGALPRGVAYGIVIGFGVLLFAVYRRLGRRKGKASSMHADTSDANGICCQEN